MTQITALLPRYEQFLRFELQRADATVSAYLSDLRGLDSAIDKPVEQIVKNDLRAYMRALGTRGISRSTVRRKVNGMSTFWKWLIDEGYIDWNVTSGIVLPKRERKFARWLSEAELRRFVETPDADPRNTLAWKLLAWLGLRRDELRRLRVGDVSVSDRLITVRSAKGQKDRVLPIPAALEDDLAEAQADGWRDAGMYLLPGDRAATGRRTASTTPSTPTSSRLICRRSRRTPYATRWRRTCHSAAIPLRIIQQWLGHERIETTGRYLHVAPEFMESALEKHVLNEVRK